MKLCELSDFHLRQLATTQTESISKSERDLEEMRFLFTETCGEMLRRWGSGTSATKIVEGKPDQQERHQ